MTSKVDSKEVGLVAGINLFHFFLGSRDLHYGLWQDDLELCIQSFPEAQKRYSDFLVSHILTGVKRELILPTFNLIGYAVSSNHPWLAKMISWKYDRKIRKMQRKYMSGERNAESFARFREYRLLLLRVSEQ